MNPISRESLSFWAWASNRTLSRMSGRLRIRWSKSFTKIHSYRLPLDCYFGFPMSSSCLPLDYLLDDTPLNCSTRQNTEDLFNGPKAYFQDLREDKMTNALVGKATVSITCIAPTENAFNKWFFLFYSKKSIKTKFSGTWLRAVDAPQLRCWHDIFV